MASVFREGKRPHYTYGVSFHDLKRDRRYWRRVGSDRATAKALADRIDRLATHRVSGEPIGPELMQWIERLPEKLRGQLVDADLIDGRRAAAGLTVEQHLNDFGDSLTTKGVTAMRVSVVTGRVRRLIELGGVKTLSDLTVKKVEHGLRVLDEAGQASNTKAGYVQAIKQFCKWAVRSGRMVGNPVEHLAVKHTGKVAKQRRPLSADEVRRLVTVTTTQPDRYGVSGPERALLYAFTAETGCRDGEVRALQACDFDLDGEFVRLTIRSATTKNRKERSMLLTTGLSDLMREHLGSKLPTAAAFKLPSKYNMADMLRRDCEAAQILVVDDAGRQIDFHALRTTSASLLVAGGFDVKLAQQRLGHHDPTLTLKVYAMTYREGEADAMRRMPDLTAAPNDSRTRATGTHDGPAVVDEAGHDTAQHSAQHARNISAHEASSRFVKGERDDVSRDERKP